MAKKGILFKTKGMNRDISVSAFSPEFSYENRNMRLSTNDGNTMMSWVNEKGPKKLEVEIDTDPWKTEDKADKETSIQGIPIGTAVIDHQLVLFTTTTDIELIDAGKLEINESVYKGLMETGKIAETDAEVAKAPAAINTKYDRIYVLRYADNAQEKMEGELIFEGNLNFSTKNPLETLVAYESSIIEKVYFNDGLNQPRVINIKADSDKLEKWNSLGNGTVATFFDFVPAVTLKETFEVTKNATEGGLFAPGVIQYCLTYINKYGQQSNIVAVSKLFYLSHLDRGASPEEKVSCSFNIKIDNADSNFDYIRLYSIQRTSEDSTPVVRMLNDIEIDGSSSYTYVDNGTTGTSVDPTELLYIGGKEISAYTMADKDNTLFLGNIVEKNTFVGKVQDYFDSIRGTSDDINIEYCNDGRKTLYLDHAYGTYSNTNFIGKFNQEQITTFKGGETYRFGLQFQKRTGEWLEPIWIEDKENDKYPATTIDKSTTDYVSLVYAKGTVDLSKLRKLVTNFDTVIKRVRPVIVYPNIGDRTVLCQGVLNPTVFNVEDRTLNAPFAQASWFFRPYVWEHSTEDKTDWNTTGTDDEKKTFNPDEYIEVKSDKYTSSNIVVETDTSHLFDSQMQEVRVLVAYVSEGELGSILERGTLRLKSTFNGSTAYLQSAFYGVIRLKDKYAFIARTTENDGKGNGYISFKAEDDNYTYNGDGKDSNLDNLYAVEYTDSVFKIYKNLELTDKKFLYYIKKDVNHDPYNFFFIAGNSKETKRYQITFHAVETAEYVLLTKDDDKSATLPFAHYSSLRTIDDITESASAFSTSKLRELEIQGSERMYDSPYSTDPIKTNNNPNNQFFVDQSIVTLNSPDLDFDTEVQSYSTDGLKLRIVGAIPITAYASSHSITRSTAMLELSHNTGKAKGYFGRGDLGSNVIYNNVSINAGKRLVSDFLWHDAYVKIDGSVTTGEAAEYYLVYPWQRSGSLNNDTRTEKGATNTSDNKANAELYDPASSWLKTKKEASLSYSMMTKYLTPTEKDEKKKLTFENIGVQIPLTENAEVMNYKLAKQKDTSVDMNYYANVDKALVNPKGYRILTKDAAYDNITSDTASGVPEATEVNSPVSMRYKSTTHAVIALDAGNVADDNGNITIKGDDIPVLPYPEIVKNEGTESEEKIGETGKGLLKSNITKNTGNDTFWGTSNITFEQNSVNLHDIFGITKYNFLWLGELYKDVNESTRFGGTSEAALKADTWLVAGDAVDVSNSRSLDGKQNITLYWTVGDTYFQRYDCLKTYPFSNEDTNQLVEILSFMCETRTNIDGRYDRNRGAVDNTYMSPTNFNLLNTVYSQKDNFFNYHKYGIKTPEELSYVNQIYYSKTKTSGADIDVYTNVTLASTLEMDGDKGSVNALKRFNNQLIAFQDTGIAQILYNENVQIPTEQGVPIELANSGKVQGKRYYSDTIGCSNKYSIAQTPSGLYFMDNNDKSIYLFNGELRNISTANGFNAWCKQNIPIATSTWTPDKFGNFAAYYDKLNQDVMFINDSDALAYSERTGAFTSFYDYGGTPYFDNLDNTGIWVRNDSGNATLWKHNAGEYCNFFGEEKPYWMTLIANQEPQESKIFTNAEMRASVDGDGSYDDKEKFTPTLPFDNLETWDDYQHGIAELGNSRSIKAMLHHTLDNKAFIKRKFRIWRCDIPRDNAPVDAENEPKKGIFRSKVRPMDRMRNPWLYLKLEKEKETGKRMELHDVLITYYS